MDIKELRQQKIKEIEFRARRKQLLVDTIKDLLDEKILNGRELSEILKITPATLSRIKNEPDFSLSAKAVEKYLKNLITE